MLTRLVLAMLLWSSTAIAGPGIGVMADVGVPDGATASLAVRPVRSITVHAGVGHNYVSRGVRAGVTVAPFASSVIRPTLSVDYGRYAEGDANPIVRMVSGDASYYNATLERLGYDFANAHVGFEIGHRFMFYVRAGASRMTGAVHGLAADSESITFTQEPRATLWTVSARLGFALYLK